MLQVYKYDTGDWGQNWMWQYSNPNLTLSDPKYLYLQTPVRGTINLTLTNDTGSAISNATTTTNTVSTSYNNNYMVQYNNGNWQLVTYSTTRYVRYFDVTAGVTYTIKDSITATRTKYYGVSATKTWPTSGNPRSLEAGGGSFTSTTTFTASVTGRCYVSYAPSESYTSNPSLTVTSTVTSYNLILEDQYYNTINVDLGQSTLAVDETITVLITLPSSTDSLTFYNNTGGAQIQGYWPEVSIPYTGWSVRNLNDGFIKYCSSGSWI